MYGVIDTVCTFMSICVGVYRNFLYNSDFVVLISSNYEVDRIISGNQVLYYSFPNQ